MLEQHVFFFIVKLLIGSEKKVYNYYREGTFYRPCKKNIILVLFFLPETLGTKLPENMEEAINLGNIIFPAVP